MGRFSLHIDVAGLKEDQSLHLNALSDDQKRSLTRFMIANGEALLQAKPEDFGRLVEVFNYAVLQAFRPTHSEPDELAPSPPSLGVEEV